MYPDRTAELANRLREALKELEALPIRSEAEQTFIRTIRALLRRYEEEIKED
jgi:hypothetical protein